MRQSDLVRILISGVWLSLSPFSKPKGQLISKCPFGVIKSPPQKPTKFLSGFLPYSLKRGQIRKIRALYTTNWTILFLLSYTTFLI